MDTQSIIAKMEAERDRLDAAIRALRGDHKRKPRAGKRQSASTRRPISQKMKLRWAERKREGKKLPRAA